MNSETPEYTKSAPKRPCCHCHVNSYTCAKKFVIILNDMKRDLRALESYYKTSGDQNLKCIQAILSSAELDLKRIEGMVNLGQAFMDSNESEPGGTLFHRACEVKCVYKDLVSMPHVRNCLPNSEICKSFNKILTLEDGALRIGSGLDKMERPLKGSAFNRETQRKSRVEVAYHSEGKKTVRKQLEEIKLDGEENKERTISQLEIRRDILEKDLERVISGGKSDLYDDSAYIPVKAVKSDSNIQPIASSFRDSSSMNAFDCPISSLENSRNDWQSTDTANDLSLSEEDFQPVTSDGSLRMSALKNVYIIMP